MGVLLYGHPLSANVHRVRLTLAFLAIPYEERTVDLLRGEHLKPDYGKINPIRQVPALVDDGKVVFDSHAIAIYLARTWDGERLLPRSSYEEARVLQWLFFDTNEVHNGIGFARNQYKFGIPSGADIALARGKKGLAVLENALQGQEWLELDRPTLADIACYPLVALAGDASIDLGEFPGVSAWLKRFQDLPRFVPMPS
jgi:glutathione S-transferase